MIGYLVVFIIAFLFALFLVNFERMKDNAKKTRKIKRYKNLLNGTPKRTVFLASWHDLYEYRDYPLYVNGKILGIDYFHSWHCNDIEKRIIDNKGLFLGYLKMKPVRRYIDKDERIQIVEHFCIAESINGYGPSVFPSAVIEVY